ncbi:hypothetical protein D3C75_884610 [compost metagenome]
MVPAHQGLGGIELARGQAQFRLVKHLQLFVFDRFTQMIFQLQALQGAGLQAIGVELEIVTAQMLGVLHGHVRLTDQCGYFPGVIRQQADAHGSTDHQLMTLDSHRQTQFGRQACRHPRQTGEVAVGIEQHGEFIAGQARDGVCLR